MQISQFITSKTKSALSIQQATPALYELPALCRKIPEATRVALEERLFFFFQFWTSQRSMNRCTVRY